MPFFQSIAVFLSDRKSGLKSMLFILVALLSLNTLRGQQTDVVDFLSVKALIVPFSDEKKIQGAYTATFKILEETDSIYLDAVDIKLLESFEEDIQISVRDKKWVLRSDFQVGKTYTISFRYEAAPKQTLYFVEDQIWTQGQGKYTSHWLPSIDDMNDKMEFDLTINSQKNKTVIANGALVSKIELDTVTSWQFNMKNAMSSYLAALAIGDFEKKNIQSNSGIPIALYYQAIDSNKVEPTYRYTKEIFDFLETEIGVPYPWQNYKQVPVRDFLYAGMENTTSTFFSEAFVVDSIGFSDRNYVNVNAHELAHQWFGNLVTETDGTHHWLHEGFASYYALLAEKELFGGDYYYWKLLQTAEQLKVFSNEGKGESLLNPKASSLTFYEKGTWALHVLNELIGEETFRIAVKNYLNKHAFKNVTTEDFISEVRAATAVDITDWEADWLDQSAFQETQAFRSLMKSEFVQNYFAIKQLNLKPIVEKKEVFMGSMEIFSNDFIGQEIVYQLANESISETLEIYKKAFESENMYVRQAIALSLQPIPKELQIHFESLLDDPSYVTKEAALYSLWIHFPKKQTTYLSALEEVVGFQDKNVRLLWLTLALVTPGYKMSEKLNIQNELKSYTSPEYSFEVRERAFGYIQELGLYDELVLKNLVNAVIHHNWRFRKYARTVLENAIEIPQYKGMLVANFDNFTEAERHYLNSIITK